MRFVFPPLFISFCFCIFDGRSRERDCAREIFITIRAEELKSIFKQNGGEQVSHPHFFFLLRLVGIFFFCVFCRNRFSWTKCETRVKAICLSFLPPWACVRWSRISICGREQRGGVSSILVAALTISIFFFLRLLFVELCCPFLRALIRRFHFHRRALSWSRSLPVCRDE